MERRYGSSLSGLILFLAILLFSTSATAQSSAAYCSNENTADTSAFYWQYQSNGKCTEYCQAQGTYAFAVIMYQNCWCSNYIPSQQVDTSECEVDCPGYPSDKCGDASKGLYIYIGMGGIPSGTLKSSQPATSASVSSAAPRPSTEAPSSMQAITSTVQSVVPSAKPSTTLQIVPTTIVTTQQAPVTSVWVVTESGDVLTQTVVVDPTTDAARTKSSTGGNHTGAIIGGVVGGVLGLLAIVGAVLFALWRRRKQQREQQGQVGGSSGITRNTSTMSKAGLIGNCAEKDSQHPPHLLTNLGSQRSRHDGDSTGPNTPSDPRHSQPLIVDSRLDPRTVLTFHGANASRDSLASIDDSRDYGRQLNVRNPDLISRE